MKILCACGHPIRDQSDFIRNKARLLADQDDEDFRALDPYADRATDLERLVWRCSECGRLALDTTDGLAWFMPENDVARGQVLRSARGDAWRGHLRGHWREGRGEVWWNTNVEQGFEQPVSEESVYDRYYEVLRRLRSKDILRDACLRTRGTIVHHWSHPDHGCA